jgi:hypothetical protein
MLGWLSSTDPASNTEPEPGNLAPDLTKLEEKTF